MLRTLARRCVPALRAIASESSAASQPSNSIARTSSLLAFQRTFASSSFSHNSESDKSASTQQLESQASGQPTTDPTSAGSSNVSEALQRELEAHAETESAATATAIDESDDASAAEAHSSGGRQPASSNLDDILGSVSAVSSLPGSTAAAESEEQAFRDTRAPLIRGAAASRYSPALFHFSSTLPHRLFVNSSRNNTILTLTSPSGDPLASASGGSVGFKKSARSGYEAGYRAAFSMFGKINEFKDAWRISHLEVLWNGFGQGREAVFRALLTGEGQPTKGLISKMTDKTPVKIGGVRPKKRRML